MASHNADCTLSFYFVDFPTEGVIRRMHTAESHGVKSQSNHGTITYAVQIKNGVSWTFHLGRVQSGNCSGTGMTLEGLGTEILISKIGN